MRKKYKLLQNDEKWYSSSEIKSISVIKEIDISLCSVPSIAIDVTLFCNIDENLTFKINDFIKLYENDRIIFMTYVTSSQRKSSYEWSLSLGGCMKYLEGITYYGGVYSADDDYLGKEFYNGSYILNGEYAKYEKITDVCNYVPKDKDCLRKIVWEMLGGTGIGCDFHVVADEFSKILHKVGLPITDPKTVLTYVGFLSRTYIDDYTENIIKLKKLGDSSKLIAPAQILNNYSFAENEKKNLTVYTYQYEMLNSGRGLMDLRVRKEDKPNYQNVSYADVWKRTPTEDDARTFTANSGHTSQTTAKSETDELRKFDAPVSSINLRPPGTGDDPNWYEAVGARPSHPNYSPVGEVLYDGYDLVKYEIVKNENKIVMDEGVKTFSEVDISLLSPEWYKDIEGSIKNSFAYDGVCSLKIVERPDSLALYGKPKYGQTKYGVDTCDVTYDIGDKVNFSLNGKNYEGYITRMSYGLNGNVTIKDCEITCNRRD